MYRYVLSRLGLLAVSLLGLSMLVFVLLRVVPGDAAVFLAGADNTNVQHVEEIRRSLGLNDPIPVQYLRWVLGSLQGDLGQSLFTRETVGHALSVRLPVSVELGLLSLSLAVLVALPVGIISALKQDTWTDQSLRLMSIIGLAVPNFWLGTMAIVFGSKYLNWIPPVGYESFFASPSQNLQQFMIPAVILGAGLSASLVRMLRSSMLEVLREDYIRTARAKGLDTMSVVRRHMLKNAMIPVVTLFGIQAGTIVGGAVIIENIFNLPGMGRLVIDAISRRDYPLVQGVVMAFGTFILLVNLVTDIVYVWLDPRISYR
jgi:peptide/nickel transport system permease protein